MIVSHSASLLHDSSQSVACIGDLSAQAERCSQGEALSELTRKSWLGVQQVQQKGQTNQASFAGNDWLSMSWSSILETIEMASL